MSIKKAFSLNSKAVEDDQVSAKRRRSDRCFSFKEVSIEPGKSLKDLDSNKFKNEIKRWAKAVVAYARQLKTDCIDTGKQACGFSIREANNHIDEHLTVNGDEIDFTITTLNNEHLIINEDGTDFTITTLDNKQGTTSSLGKFRHPSDCEINDLPLVMLSLWRFARVYVPPDRNGFDPFKTQSSQSVLSATLHYYNTYKLFIGN
ncbi:hypothetical protein SADUNF_Sadunf01G0140800 [Salix dunnii]|uniref:Uncharacterized protein n=1 Tax=Salix dunnii TaxID=1413687 RepID=A0A835NBS9_9ROSI|nr:hypothetical protein SADUNF_Sadunf01G0140800 [Salix dunnii]